MQKQFKLILFINLILLTIYLIWKQNKAYFNEKYEIITKEKPRNVFFDLGANIGDSAENFLGFIDKASDFNDMKNLIPTDKLNENWIIYLFEGNSKFDENLLNIKKKYSSNKHEIIVYNSTIITDHDGYIDFWISNNKLASSIIKNNQFVIDSKQKETKPCVDLARILKLYKQNDFVVVKMDIEGAEFELILHLIKENVLSLIDVLAIEYHKNLSPYKSEYALLSRIYQKFNISEKNWN